MSNEQHWNYLAEKELHEYKSRMMYLYFDAKEKKSNQKKRNILYNNIFLIRAHA